MAPTPTKARRAERHAQALDTAEKQVTARRALIDQRVSAFATETSQSFANETAAAGYAEEQLQDESAGVASRPKMRNFLADLTRLRAQLAAAEAAFEMARDLAPSPEASPEKATQESPANTVQIDLFGTPVFVPATPTGAALVSASELLQEMRKKEVSPLLSALRDESLQDESVMKQVVAGLREDAFAAVSASLDNRVHGAGAGGGGRPLSQKRSPEELEAELRKLRKHNASKHARRLYGGFADDEEQDDSGGLQFVGSRTFSVMSRPQSGPLDAEPAADGYLWSNALVACTGGVPPKPKRNAELGLLLKYNAQRPETNPLRTGARRLLIYLYEAYAFFDGETKQRTKLEELWEATREEAASVGLAKPIPPLLKQEVAMMVSRHFKVLIQQALDDIAASSLAAEEQLSRSRPLIAKLRDVEVLHASLAQHATSLWSELSAVLVETFNAARGEETLALVPSGMLPATAAPTPRGGPPPPTNPRKPQPEGPGGPPTVCKVCRSTQHTTRTCPSCVEAFQGTAIPTNCTDHHLAGAVREWRKVWQKAGKTGTKPPPPTVRGAA